MLVAAYKGPYSLGKTSSDLHARGNSLYLGDLSTLASEIIFFRVRAIETDLIDCRLVETVRAYCRRMDARFFGDRLDVNHMAG